MNPSKPKRSRTFFIGDSADYERLRPVPKKRLADLALSDAVPTLTTASALTVTSRSSSNPQITRSNTAPASISTQVVVASAIDPLICADSNFGDKVHQPSAGLRKKKRTRESEDLAAADTSDNIFTSSLLSDAPPTSRLAVDLLYSRHAAAIPPTTSLAEDAVLPSSVDTVPMTTTPAATPIIVAATTLPPGLLSSSVLNTSSITILAPTVVDQSTTSPIVGTAAVPSSTASSSLLSATSSNNLSPYVIIPPSSSTSSSTTSSSSSSSATTTSTTTTTLPSSASSRIFPPRPPTTTAPAHLRPSPYRKNFVPPLVSTTPLLQIPTQRIGTLIGLINSVKTLPLQLLPSIRNIFCLYYDKVVQSPNDSSLWRKVFLLPLVLFTVPPRQSFTLTLKQRIKLLQRDDWSTFTLGFISTHLPPLPSLASSHDNLGLLSTTHSSFVPRRVATCIKEGNFSKATSILLDRTPPTTLSPEQVFQKLQDKNPTRNDSHFSAAAVQELLTPLVHAPTSEHLLPDIQYETLFAIIKGKDRGKSAGLDKLRFEHLQDLLGTNFRNGHIRADMRRFGDSLTDFLNLILNLRIPPDMLSFFTDCQILALPKSQTDVRPIGLTGVYRKLIVSFALRHVHTATETFIAPHQYGMSKHGTEVVIHTVRSLMEANPHFDVFAMDASNAFNRVSRLSALSTIKEHFPSVFNLILRLYGANTNLWFHGLDSGICSILSSEGSIQGDAAGTWFFVVALQPLLSGLQTILGDRGSSLFFVDDGTLVGDPAVLTRAIDYLIQQGPKYGFHLNLEKCSYLIGRTSSTVDFTPLTQLGLVDSIIHQHPLQGGNANAYGFKLLGSFIGSECFIHTQLAEYLAQCTSQFQLLSSTISDLQQRLLLFRVSFIHKIDHLFRTLPPHLSYELVGGYNTILRRFMSNFLFDDDSISNNTSLSDITWQQLQLNIQDGGIGLGVTDHMRFVSYLSSFIHCSSSIFSHHSRITPAFSFDNLITNHSPALYDDFCQQLTTIPPPDAASSTLIAIRAWQLRYHDTFIHSSQQQPNILHSIYYCMHHINNSNLTIPTLFNVSNTTNKKLQHELSTFMYTQFFTKFMQSVSLSNNLGFIAHIGSIQNEDSGRWITLSPKFPAYTITSSDFRVSLLRRCYLAQPSITQGLHCDCSRHPLLDIQGRHFTTGCNKGSHRIECHDQLKTTINSICRYSGCSTRVEERNCFANLNADNEDGDGRRPDLTVSNFKNAANQDVLLDISVTQSYPGSQRCSLPTSFSRTQANSVKDNHSEANQAYQKKINKYSAVAQRNNYLFQPIIFEANGYIHPQSLQCIKDLATLSSTRFNRSASAVLSYFRNQLSVTLNISLAKSIQRRSAELIHPTTRHNQTQAEEYRLGSNFSYFDRGARRRA